MTTRPLDRLRGLARAVLLFELAWPALWPSVAILGGLACAALLGLVSLLPPAAHAGVVLLALGSAAVLGWVRLRTIALPDNTAADRRLEQASGLTHRPLGTLADSLASGGGDADLWRAHRARTERLVLRLRVGLPHPGLARRDAMALRHLLVLGLVVACGVAGMEAPGRLLGLAEFGGGPSAPATPPRMDVWLGPPAYTGMPPLLLTPAQPEATVPAGSRLTATVSGGGAPPELRLDGNAIPFQSLDASTWQATSELRGGGHLVARAGGGVEGHWDLTVVADVPPVVRWAAPPDSTAGRIPQTRFPWQATHPYGMAALRVEMRLVARPEVPPLVVDIPLPGTAPRDARGVRRVDLTAHPWAGLPVRIRLVGRDTGGLDGMSDSRALTLPERRFLRPAARAVVAVRKQLAVAPDDRAAPLLELDRLAGDEALWDGDPGGYLNLRVIRDELAGASRGTSGQPAIDGLQDRLWQLALHLEEESPARTAERLAQARRELKSTLDAARAAPKDGAQTEPQKQSQTESKTQAEAQAAQERAKQQLREREQALQQALRNHMQALRREAQRDPQGAPPPEALSRQAEKALQALREATESGQDDAAQQSEAELEQTLDALEQARRDASTTPRQKKRAEGRERGRKQMGVLQDLIRREGGIVDRSQARAQGVPSGEALTPDTPPSVPQGPAAPPGSPGEALAQADASERAHDGRVQRALRRALGEMMQQYGDLTGSVPPFLGDADRAMRDANEALAAGQDEPAAAAASRAVAALQEGGQAMSQQLAQQFGRGRDRQKGQSSPGEGEDQGEEGGPTGNGDTAQPGDGTVGQGDGETGRNTDPFGRALHEGENGATDGGDTAVPETMEQARTRAVQDELRRRGADRTRPPRELDYIRRLLDMP